MPSSLKSEFEGRFQGAYQEILIPVKKSDRFPEMKLRKAPHFIPPDPCRAEKIRRTPEKDLHSRKDLITDMIGCS